MEVWVRPGTSRDLSHVHAFSRVHRGKTHPRLACPAPASSGSPEMHFSFVKQSLHQFCIQILSRCTSNRLQVTKSYPTKRNGGPWSQGPRRRHLHECTVCQRRGPRWPFRHALASSAGVLMAARMASGVREPKPSEIMKAHKVGELRRGHSPR